MYAPPKRPPRTRHNTINHAFSISRWIRACTSKLSDRVAGSSSIVAREVLFIGVRFKFLDRSNHRLENSFANGDGISRQDVESFVFTISGHGFCVEFEDCFPAIYLALECNPPWLSQPRVTLGHADGLK